MPKYYVESGDLRMIVQAERPIPAAAKALSWARDFDRLQSHVVVNERGFLGCHTPRPGDSGMVVLETGTLLSLIAEHELA